MKRFVDGFTTGRLETVHGIDHKRHCPKCGSVDPEYGTPDYNKTWKFEYEITDYICEVGYLCECGQHIVAFY